MMLPTEISIDAWTGAEAARGQLVPGASRWGARRESIPSSQAALEFGAPADPHQWCHPDVGYGVLLRDPGDPAWSVADRAAAKDAEGPVRALLAARPGTVVLRWRPELADRYVLRYYDDGTEQREPIGLSGTGVGRGRLPRYVVIVGGPDTVPWSVQYALAVRHAVGRLPLSGEALGGYVEALLTQWHGADLDVDAPVLWTVDHGGGDITSLMRSTLTAPLEKAMTGTLPGIRHVSDGGATAAGLCDALVAARPALVVTSSHGMTGPLEQPEVMADRLGVPVDAGFAAVDLDELDAAMPGGAVWFAQACCSAGGDGISHYAGLLTPDSVAETVVEAVAGLGPRVAPAAMRLLSRERPVRAVLGHVEPTFSSTLWDPGSGKKLSGDLVVGLTTNLFFGQPLGLAFGDYYAGVGMLHTQWAHRRELLEGGRTSDREELARLRDELTWLRLTALDRQSLVLLGDPTATLPPRTGT